jgi:hypothetical protein
LIRFLSIWYILWWFGIFFPRTKKNLATLFGIAFWIRKWLF